MTRAIMLQGTGSDVGKTVLVAGLCRLARHRGLDVAPFKPQNMSNNAAIASNGKGGQGEIGRAQWLQAFASEREPTVHMNPVLLKPQSETGSQIVLRGQVVGTARGRDYQRLKAGLLREVLESYRKLEQDADLIIVEGAGSPAEVNLRSGDIANMGFACAANVPVVLVGDIDRGGVIASLVGTHTVLDPEDRAMIKAFLINKFRGDVSLFDEGLRIVTQHTGWPSLGVVPWLGETRDLPAEDSVILERLSNDFMALAKAVKVVVPVLGRIANFDDLDPLRAEPGVKVVMVRKGEAMPDDADVILLPGSKATLADLAELRSNGWDRSITKARSQGKRIVGICGGYQMLGRTVSDPYGIEGGGRADGLGLLEVDTVLEQEKTTRLTSARSLKHDVPVSGYEIHLGRTEGADRDRAPFVANGSTEGAASRDGKVWGTYLHGAFDGGPFRQAWLAEIGVASDGENHHDRIDAALDAIAARLDALVDFDELLGIAAERGGRR